MSGRNQKEPYFPRDSQPLRPRPVDYSSKLNHITPQTQMNANRSKTAERIRGHNGYTDASLQYRSNPRIPSDKSYAVENRLNTSVDYRSSGGRRSSETNANQQKAKFLFFAIQKCMRKAMWKTFVSKLEQCKAANSMSYHYPQALSKTLPLDEFSGLNDSRSINYSDIRHPNVSYIDHYTPYKDGQKSFVHPRNSLKPNPPQAYHSNQKSKNASFSAILPELQNEWSPDTNNEIYFPKSNCTSSQRNGVDPNHLNIQGYASNSSWGHTKYLDNYSSQQNSKIPLGKNTSQRSSFYNPRDYQSNQITAGSYMLSNTSKDKNYELFALLLKKTLEGFQKKSKASSFTELKEFYKRALNNEKGEKGNITREEGSIEPIATLEESNLLEYSNRTLLSPSNAAFPVHLSARQQKLYEVMNRERRLKAQLLVMTLQKTFRLRMKESFTRIAVFDDKPHIKDGGRILLLTMFLQKKIAQQQHCSLDSIKTYSQEVKNYRSQQVQKGLILQLLLRRSIAARKNQALNIWREFASRARQAAHEKKDVLLSKNLNSMVTKYKDITNSYEKINKRYSEFCQRPRRSTTGNDDSFSMSFTQDPLDKENFNKGQAIHTPSKAGSIRKVHNMSWARQKSIEGLVELISKRVLKDAFNQLRKRPFFINIQGLKEIEKSNKLQPKTTSVNTSLDLKISKSLLETFQQSAKKESPPPRTSETKSNQNTTQDLQSAINFLKGL